MNDIYTLPNRAHAAANSADVPGARADGPGRGASKGVADGEPEVMTIVDRLA
jgi:hypothetical protein